MDYNGTIIRRLNELVREVKDINASLTHLLKVTIDSDERIKELSHNMTIFENEDSDIISPDDDNYVFSGDVVFEKPKSRSLRKIKDS